MAGLERINMAEGAGQSPDIATTVPQAENIGAKSPVSDISPELFKTLNQRHSPEFIQAQRDKYPTREAFLEDAEKEAEHIRLTFAQQAAATKTEQVMANAALPNEQRLQATEKLLGPLTEEQAKALKRMHEVGKDRPGAGVYNYNREEVREKVRIGREKTETGKSVFSREERRKLFEAGLVGVLPADKLGPFEPDDYSDPKLNRIAKQLQRIVKEGNANETVFRDMSRRIGDLIDRDEEGKINDDQAQELLSRLAGWEIEAIEPSNPEMVILEGQLDKLTALLEKQGQSEQRIERRQASSSEFEQTASQYDAFEKYIKDLRVYPPSAEREARLLQAKTESERLATDRDRLLKEAGDLKEAGEYGLYSRVKKVLFKTYYDSRVEVTYRDKVSDMRADGRPGILRSLEQKQEILNDGDSWEQRTQFWSDPQIKKLEADLKMQEGELERKYGGTIDYFNRESIRLIREVVDNPKKYQELKDYPQNGIMDLWKYTYIAPNGTEDHAENFDDIRDIVEGERQNKPKIPNRGDYESWIVFIADTPEEAENLIPKIVGSVAGKLTGVPNEQASTIQEESSKWAKAVDYLREELHYEPGDPKFRRLKTMLLNEIKLMAIEVFSELVDESWDPFLQNEADFARGFKDTKYQDHIVDGLYFDRTGIKAAAFEKLAENDWEIYRFGPNNRTTHKTQQYGDALRQQQEMKDDIENWLVNNELKPMTELLNIDKEGQDLGDPNHPAFNRLKDKLAVLDSKDPRFGQPGFKSRWQEYVEKALEWQKTGVWGDSRDKKQRVIFQHPLARVLSEKELWDMYREVKHENHRKERRKRQLVKTYMQSVERSVRATMSDAVAGGPRHYFEDFQIEEVKDKDDKVIGYKCAYGEVKKEDGKQYLEIFPNLKFEIKKKEDGGLCVNEVVPDAVLQRELLESAVLADAKKPLKRRIFKIHHLLKNVVGIELSQPASDGWYYGAHDTNRPHLLEYINNEVPKFAQMLEERQRVRDFDPKEGDVGYGYGGDAKTVITRLAEDQGRMGTLLEIIGREKYGKYYNYTGQDDSEAGVKEFRNLLFHIYGISQGTVEVNSMIKNARLGQKDLLRAFGCSNWRQFVGLLKGPDEIVFAKTRGFFANPRDAKNWVKRFASIVEQSKLWTGVGGGKEQQGALMGGFISGAYHFRARNRTTENYLSQKRDPDFATEHPENAFEEMKDAAYEGYVDTATKVAAPMMAIMEARLKLENVYGRSPQTAIFLNTLLWYDVCKWMDEEPAEFRKKFGFAYDADLELAKRFMYTALYESRLIYDDVQWDQVILGYTIPKFYWDQIQKGEKDAEGKVIVIDNKGQRVYSMWDRQKEFKVVRYKADADGNTLDDQGKIVKGEIVEGLLDALPVDLRKEALAKKWLPVGLNSYKPESLETLKRYYSTQDSGRMKQIYEKVFQNAANLSQTRRPIKRS